MVNTMKKYIRIFVKAKEIIGNKVKLINRTVDAENVMYEKRPDSIESTIKYDIKNYIPDI